MFEYRCILCAPTAPDFLPELIAGTLCLIVSYNDEANANLILHTFEFELHLGAEFFIQRGQRCNEDNQVDVAIRLRVIIIYWLRWHVFFNCQISANFRYRLN